MNAIKVFYEEHGYYGPVRAFEPEELADELRTIFSLTSWPDCRNRHLDVPAVAKVCTHARVVAVLRAVLGPDLVLWRSNIFAISPASYALPWHQDEYRGLLAVDDPALHCSAQMNLNDATPGNCVAIVPGSHRWCAEELYRRGYSSPDPHGAPTPVWNVPPGEPSLDVQLEAGEFYVFHPRLLHTSVLRAGTSAAAAPARYSIALRVATADTPVLPAAFDGTPTRASCVLLAGRDRGANALGSWAQ